MIRKHFFLSLVMGLVGLMSLGGHAAAQGDDPKQLVDVGGYSLYLDCQGQGSPTVILEAGLGMTGRTWLDVQPDIAQETRVCAYDRAGVGGSDPSLLSPRPASVMAEELHTLLANAHLDGPYVLVAHSYGGFVSRLFANQYPDEVVGMVLIDTAQEDFDYRIPADSAPDEIFFGNREGVTVGEWQQSVEDLRALRSANNRPLYGDMPLIVLTVPLGRQPGMSENEYSALAKSWDDLQHRLAASSSNSTLIEVEDSGHFIQNDQPEIVIGAVVQVVRAAQHCQSNVLIACLYRTFVLF